MARPRRPRESGCTGGELQWGSAAHRWGEGESRPAEVSEETYSRGMPDALPDRRHADPSPTPLRPFREPPRVWDWRADLTGPTAARWAAHEREFTLW